MGATARRTYGSAGAVLTKRMAMRTPPKIAKAPTVVSTESHTKRVVRRGRCIGSAMNEMLVGLEGCRLLQGATDGGHPQRTPLSGVVSRLVRLTDRILNVDRRRPVRRT